MSLPVNNIITENGEQFIPASQRPDGTWRKARRVKEGYVPQEEVPLYESKGKQFMTKKKEPVILSTGEKAERPIPGLFIVRDEKQQKKKKSKSTKGKVDNDIQQSLADLKLIPSNEKPIEEQSADPAKKLKNLKKRLREIEALEEKINKGTLLKPEPEQLAKIQRKNDLILQIKNIEKQINK